MVGKKVYVSNEHETGGLGKQSSRVLRSPVVKGRDCFRQTLSHMEYIMSRQSVWVCFVILLGNRDTEFICFCHRKAGICFTFWLLIALKNSLLNPRHFHCLLSFKMMTNIWSWRIFLSLWVSVLTLSNAASYLSQIQLRAQRKCMSLGGTPILWLSQPINQVALLLSHQA